MLEKKCRSQYIGKYFGDNEMKLCGVCDFCLSQKNTPLTSAEFEKITEEIFSNIFGQNIEINALLQSLKLYKKEKVWTVINFLQNENKLKVNDKGMISKK